MVNAYQLAVTISLLPFASLGELRGYRRVFIAGLAVFTLGSLACALSGALTSLVASRILQSFRGAGIMSVNTACSLPRCRSNSSPGIGFNALSDRSRHDLFVRGGRNLSFVSWQWLFAINVPLGVVGLVFARRELPRTPLARHRFDWLSASLSAATFGALIIGIDNLRRLSVSVAFELGVRWSQVRSSSGASALAYPMLALELLARPVFALSVLGSICSFTAQEPDLRLAAVLPRGGARPIGSASGILATARLVGQTLGAALVGLIFALTSASPGGIGRGATLALLVGAGFAAAGAVASSRQVRRALHCSRGTSASCFVHDIVLQRPERLFIQAGFAVDMSVFRCQGRKRPAGTLVRHGPLGSQSDPNRNKRSSPDGIAWQRQEGSAKAAEPDSHGMRVVSQSPNPLGKMHTMTKR